MLRPATYSIVARDPETGALGVAVQSHWFSVGAAVPFVQAGVGAVATQSVPDPASGPRLLDALAAGATAEAALRAEIAADTGAAVRQTAVVDAGGHAAAHTGAGCIAEAGDVQRPGHSCQANMMASTAVWPAMDAAYAAAQGPVARRLLAALDAAESEGGDVRGRQSAAIAVAPAGGGRWARTVELRVEDHPEPLAELRRLLGLHEAYALAAEGDGLMAAGRHSEARERFEVAAALAPEAAELRFWAGLAVAGAGDLERGAAVVREVVTSHPGFGTLLDRLPAALEPAAPEVRAALGRR